MSSEDRLKAAFGKFDRDGSGEIDARELLGVLLDLGKSEDEARTLAGVIILPALIHTRHTEAVHIDYIYNVVVPIGTVDSLIL